MQRKPEAINAKGSPTGQDLGALLYPAVRRHNCVNLYQRPALTASFTERWSAAILEKSEMGPPDPSDIRDRRFERHVAQICELGPRAVGELLTELGARTMHMTTIEQMVEQYARLNPQTLEAVGADRFAPRPSLRIVEGRRHG